MFSKSILVIAFIAIARLAAATPAACLLAAINTNDDPSKVSDICKNDDMTGTIAKYCGNNAQAAMVSYADVCKNAGVKVATDINTTATASSSKATASSNKNASASASGSEATATGTGIVTSVTGTASATGTGAPATSTGAAGRLEAGFMAAIVGGLVAAAL